MDSESETSMQELNTLLQHLRSIHLSFILAAAAIFMALSTSNTIFETAIQQLRDVVQLADILTSDQVSTSIGLAVSPQNRIAARSEPNPLESFVETSLTEYFGAMEIYPESIELEYLSVELEREEFGHIGTIDDFLEFEAERSWFRNSLALLSDGETIYTSPLDLFAGSPKSMEGYRARLDRLLVADTLYFRPSFHEFYFSRSTRVSERYPGLPQELRNRLNDLATIKLSVSLTGIELTDSRSREVFETSQGHVQDDPVGYDDYDFRFDELLLKCRAYARGSDAIRFDLVLPVIFQVIRPEFIADALKQQKFDDVYYARYLSGARSFRRLFPELMQVSDYLMSLSPEALEDYLEDQKQRSGAPISVLGLQVSRDLIEVWGVLLMLSIQLYFCMHYRTLLDRLPTEKAIMFPWIGVYRHKLSALVFQLSIAFPLAATLYAAFRRRPASDAGLDDIALAALALTLFVWAELTYLRFRKQHFVDAT